VVVHLHDTLAASRAMVRSWWLHLVTYLAEFELVELVDAIAE
jgi:hypothetical protein